MVNSVGVMTPVMLQKLFLKKNELSLEFFQCLTFHVRITSTQRNSSLGPFRIFLDVLGDNWIKCGVLEPNMVLASDCFPFKASFVLYLIIIHFPLSSAVSEIVFCSVKLNHFIDYFESKVPLHFSLFDNLLMM